MAKTKTAVSGRRFSKFKASFKKYWFLWIPGLALVLFFCVYRPISIYLDKQRFLSAEQEIEKVADQIQAKIGPADQVAKDNSCSYASRKFERGPRSCAVRVHLLYEGQNSNAATKMMSETITLFSSDLINYLGQKNSDHFIPSESNQDQHFAQNLQTKFKGCLVEYAYPTTGGLFESSSAENFRLTLSCSSSARAEHFSVTD